MEGKIKRDEEEEEPEEKVVTGPSGETVVYSSGNGLSFLSLFSHHFINYTLLHFTILFSFTIGWIGILNHASLSHLGSSCLHMSLMKRRKWWLGPRRNRSWGDLCMEGGCLTLDEREAQGLLCEVLVSVQHNSPSLLPQFCSPYATVKSDMSDYIFFLSPFGVSICYNGWVG